jgi:oligoribonuclease NrnB/cAMP/cGMP phosphodiesterase (DHH superfamily)
MTKNLMNKEACIYHKGDLDGFCSGAIVRHLSSPGMKMLPLEYGDPIPWEELEGCFRVYVVDFCLEPLETSMVRLEKMVDEVVWIDHHKSAIDSAAEINFNPPGLRRVGDAACELCWEYFLKSSVTIPQAVKFLGRYDVWDLKAHVDVMPFQLGMQAQAHTNPIDPESEAFWTLAFNSSEEFITSRVLEGKSITSYREAQYKMYQQHAHEIVFEEYSWIAINTQKVGSHAFEGIYDPLRHYGCVAYFRGGSGNWIVSLYSPDASADLSVIAKAYGGGGHPSACGFTIPSTEALGRFLSGEYEPIVQV